MGHKVFVSYKYYDTSVKLLDGYYRGTPRDYVDYLQDHHFSGDDLNKAENDNEDLSDFADETIRTKLKEKIWDSSITLVLISPNMVDPGSERKQWIPWEVSYSLRTAKRAGTRSQPNAVIAIVLPDLWGSYEYFISNKTLIDEDGTTHNVEEISTYKTFQIIGNNMFNQYLPDYSIIQGQKVYSGDCSYIMAVKWKDFIENIEFYQEKAFQLRDNIIQYDIQKEVLEDGK